MELSDFLRLPIKVGVGLTKANTTHDKQRIVSPAFDNYFRTLIDNVNQDIITNLVSVLPTDAYLLAFVRGSVVQNRLETAQTCWQRIRELFELDEILEELNQTYEKRTLEKVTSEIKTMVIAKLLRDRDRFGPAKLLFRMKKTQEDAFSPSMNNAVVELISTVSQWSQDCDESIIAVFFATDLGNAQESVRRQFNLLLGRYGLHSVAPQIFADFDQFVQMQKDAMCLHPALPITEKAVRGIAAAFGVGADVARRLIYLFRFAWICRLEKVSDLSDFTPKSTVVISQCDTAQKEVEHQAETVLMLVFSALEYTMQFQVDLQQFREKYPDIRVRISAFVLSLPSPLYEVFVAFDSEEHRLTFLSKYYMGNAYFMKYIKNLFHNTTYNEKLHKLDAKYQGQLSTGLRSLVERIVYVKTKTAKDGNIKYERDLPLDASPRKTRQLLENALVHQEGGYMEQCAWLFNETAKNDLAGNIRGMHTMTRVRTAVEQHRTYE